MKKDLLSIYDLSRGDIDGILTRAAALKTDFKSGGGVRSLTGKTLAMIFDKSSTRTRVSFEAGINQLGGAAVFLSRRDIQLDRGETVTDTAQVLSRYVDGIVIRTYAQDLVETFARFAAIPVINGLTDLLHPCQVLSDLFTIVEVKGGYEGIVVAYVGDGNNMANSWINAAAKLPFRLRLACPEKYDPDGAILARGLSEAAGRITMTRSPQEAVQGADVIYTDVWASMGQEAEAEERSLVFRPYQVNASLLDLAAADVVVMHCLPAHRGEEITADVIDGNKSIVFDQAENRLHVQKAIMEIFMGGNSSEQ